MIRLLCKSYSLVPPCPLVYADFLCFCTPAKFSKWRSLLSLKSQRLRLDCGLYLISNSEFCAVQIHLYLPSKQHPSFGIVRSIVKDYMDGANMNVPVENTVFLDSDGQVNNIYNGPKNIVSTLHNSNHSGS